MMYTRETNYYPPSEKQLRMIKALAWQLRRYYSFEQWGAIREKLLLLLRFATMQKCSRLIQRMLSVKEEKEKQNAKIIWFPMQYSLDNASWQANILRLASHFFPDESFELDSSNLATWRALKNRVEREELLHSYENIPDEFEHDTRFAQDEELRWKSDKRPYAELIEGVDFLEPTIGIDW